MPVSHYGLKPVNPGTFSNGFNRRRPSATTRTFTRLHSSAESLNRETSVKQLRMSNYLQGSSMAASATKLGSTVGFKQRSSSRSKTIGGTKSPAQKNPQTFSASRLAAESRMSLVDTSVHVVAKYPTMDFKTDEDFAIRILDNMIQVEEDMKNGFSMYNRGKKLKKSLINPERVKEYLQAVERAKEVKNFATAHEKRQLDEDQLISLEDQSEVSIEQRV